MMRILRNIAPFGVLLVALYIPIFCNAFRTNPNCFGNDKSIRLQRKGMTSFCINTVTSRRSVTRRKHTLQMAIFDDIAKFFEPDNDDDDDDVGRRKKSYDLSQKNNRLQNNVENNGDGDDECDDGYAGTSRIFEIPAKRLKIGGMRLYLSLHLMGERNNPEKDCWKLDQNGDGGIDLYYRDRTAAIFINFTERGVTFDRFGSAPSMQYTMHETIILNSILDKLYDITFDQTIPESDRLMQLNQPCNALQEARDMLSFS